jgi:hypothetical protein
MGTKVSTMANKKRKRITSSLLHHSKSKTYNMDSSINEISSPCRTLNEKDASSTTAVGESDSHVSSINESMFTAGRTFHHVENSAYWFPNDDEEMDRLIGVREHINESLKLKTNSFCIFYSNILL